MNEAVTRTLILPEVSNDTPLESELVAALPGLEKGTRPDWGRMNASQMLRHCSWFTDLYLGRSEVPCWTRWVSRFAGPPFLRRFLTQTRGETPRNLGTLRLLRIREKMDLDFLKERSRLAQCLLEVEALEGTVCYSIYGPMNARYVRAVVRHHTAHHFHQFGLL